MTETPIDPILRHHGVVHCEDTGHFVALGLTGTWTVFAPKATYAESDSSYNDLSLAIARCQYLAERALLRASRN